MRDTSGADLSEAPIFRWAGSKLKTVPILAEYWQEGTHKRYVEPFAGSAVLFFRLSPPAALISDLNADLIQCYEMIRDYPEAVHASAAALSPTPEQYYRVRKQDPSRLTALRRAARFVYLNRYCFNGIYRTNKQGDFNVPFGGSRMSPFPGVDAFRRCSLLLRQARLSSCDFGTTLGRTRRGDFVYLDPPYTTNARRVFRSYGPKEFSLLDLERLNDHLDRMSSRGVSFILSYADCREARAVFRAWERRRIPVRRHIAGFASSRRMSYELLVTNIR